MPTARVVAAVAVLVACASCTPAAHKPLKVEERSLPLGTPASGRAGSPTPSRPGASPTWAPVSSAVGLCSYIPASVVSQVLRTLRGAPQLTDNGSLDSCTVQPPLLDVQAHQVGGITLERKNPDAQTPRISAEAMIDADWARNGGVRTLRPRVGSFTHAYFSASDRDFGAVYRCEWFEDGFVYTLGLYGDHVTDRLGDAAAASVAARAGQ